jgi:hypothetical protein
MENIANGFQLVPHGIAKHKCIGLMRHGVDVDHRPVGNPKRKV